MSVFYDGDLTTAIAAAQQARKDFACFVYATEEDDADVAALSSLWTDELDANELVRNYFLVSSILMRIRVNSTEYQYLSAVVPDIQAPSIIIIRQGQVQHNFTDTEALVRHCELFDQALQWQRRAIDQAASQSQTSSQTPVEVTVESEQVTSPATRHQDVEQEAQPTPTVSDQEQSIEPPAPQTSRGQPSVQTPLVPPSANRPDVSQSWAAEQRERNLQARRERDRVLAQIEADKRARKARDAERKNTAAGISSTSTTTSSSQSRAASKSGSCRIQIRLISGRTIRQTFEASATPATHLRPFIASELARDNEFAKVPAYRLKRMGIPPEPTREISLSEEQESLLELGLLPSATLVVTPIHGATEAYTDGGSGWGLLSLPVSIVGGVAGAALGAVNTVGAAVSSTLGLGARAEPDRASDERPAAAASAARVRTIHQVRADNDREDQNFYNGNQLSFQSNEGDDK